MKAFGLIFLIAAYSINLNAQTAEDFAQYDCDGNYHELYQELDSGKIVVMEFIMNCQLCIDAGNLLEIVLSQFDQQHPGVIRFYQFSYSSLLGCSDMYLFRDTNNFHSIVFEENGHQLNHYGGFGMPTVGVAAGADHKDIYSHVGFFSGDTAQLGTALRNYFATISVSETEFEKYFIVYPNPASDRIFISSKAAEDVPFRITDMSGRTLINGCTNKMTSCSFDISSLPNGIYCLNMLSKNPLFRKIAIHR
jgi:hypothetical protein